mgnify:CR=1 FL=1
MPITAREELGNLIIDFGDGTTYTVYPVPASAGIEIQSLLVGLTMGATMNEFGPDRVMSDTERVVKLAIGVNPNPPSQKRRKRAPNQAEQEQARRWQEFDSLRSARSMIVSQAAILWNTGGGGIEAVGDLFSEAGGYPKALGRVMQSSGLGDQFTLLKTYLDGVANRSATDSSATPTGGPSTSV